MEFVSHGNPEQRHRLIILTDMENEPDDSQTMVKLLMYSNELDIEGLIAVTSRWLKHTVFTESIVVRVQAYGVVRPNLMKHAQGWPTAEELLRKTCAGNLGYGMEAVGDGKHSEGSERIVAAVDSDDPRPVHVAINAGANTLAQALWDVKRTRSDQQIRQFVSKLRVYDDSGQDDAGAWMCHTFPELFYVRSQTQVFGLFGPTLDSGPQTWAPLNQWDWAETNIRIRHGILGALYPQRLGLGGPFNFMDGGGTTSWLGLINKGLYDPSQVHWGGWGGRFHPEKQDVPAGQAGVAAEEKKYSPFLMYGQAEDYSWEWKDEEGWDKFSGVHGDRKYRWPVFAPLWRWRDDYTRDFKARMDWCVADYEHANHNPVACFYDDENRSIVRLKCTPGERVTLDASRSWNPDTKHKRLQHELTYDWSSYPEAGTYSGAIEVSNSNEPVATCTIPSDAAGKQVHLILRVTDTHPEVPLTSYRRVVMDID